MKATTLDLNKDLGGRGSQAPAPPQLAVAIARLLRSPCYTSAQPCTMHNLWTLKGYGSDHTRSDQRHARRGRDLGGDASAALETGLVMGPRRGLFGSLLDRHQACGQPPPGTLSTHYHVARRLRQMPATPSACNPLAELSRQVPGTH